MGFSREAAEEALAEGLDMTKALDRLLQGGALPGTARGAVVAAETASLGVGAAEDAAPAPAAAAAAAAPRLGGVATASAATSSHRGKASPTGGNRPVARGVWGDPSGAGVAAAATCSAVATGGAAAGDGTGANVELSEPIEAAQLRGPACEAAPAAPRASCGTALGGAAEVPTELDNESAGVDWQILLGAQETALPVAAGLGLPELPRLGAASHSVGQASEAVLPLLRRMQPSVPTDVVGAEVPQRPMARAWSEWTAESPPNQLGLQKGGLVYLWDNTETELGWVYAESLRARGLSGWVPSRLLRKLPTGCVWMRSVRACDAGGEGRLAVADGEVLLVNAETATEAGWVHAETCDGSDAGWLPSSALGKLPSVCQWFLVVQTYGASYKGQLAVRDGSQVLVDPETRTTDGWVYVWAMDTEEQSGARQGWVPTTCLQWPED